MALFRNLVGIALACVSLVGYACDYPPLVEIPMEVEEGRPLERLRQATVEYLQGMTAYTECVQAELAALGDDAPELHRALLVTRNNAAVAEVEAMMQLYEERIEPPERLAAPQ